MFLNLQYLPVILAISYFVPLSVQTAHVFTFSFLGFDLVFILFFRKALIWKESFPSELATSWIV
jgi:hypothetical protein